MEFVFMERDKISHKSLFACKTHSAQIYRQMMRINTNFVLISLIKAFLYANKYPIYYPHFHMYTFLFSICKYPQYRLRSVLILLFTVRRIHKKQYPGIYITSIQTIIVRKLQQMLFLVVWSWKIKLNWRPRSKIFLMLKETMFMWS